MPNTYKKIASVVVGSGGSSAINFTSIPQTYTDLKIVVSGRTTYSGPTGQYISFNNSTENFTGRYLFSDNTTPASGVLSRYVGTVSGTATASVFNSTEIYITNYASSNNKSFSVENVSENNATYGGMNLITGLWSNSNAITSISIAPDNGSYPQHSTATLYGIGDVTASKFAKATGGLITYDSTYVYHTFTSSGIFTPNTALTVDYLVVAGGAGGGDDAGDGSGNGGGGAGGLRSTTTATGGGGSLETLLSLTAQAYTVTVGGGGAGGVNGLGTNGSNSVFSTITSTGGGGGGGGGANGSSGGSGGGGMWNQTTRTGGPGTTNQGFAGGNGASAPAYAGGGGGGASAVGANATTSVGGNGGAGITTSISGTSTTYAGGGGGGTDGASYTAGTGGSGGGGAGGKKNSTSPVAGTANTGGGGGGSGSNVNGAAGGSGIVIVRYLR